MNQPIHCLVSWPQKIFDSEIYSGYSDFLMVVEAELLFDQ